MPLDKITTTSKYRACQRVTVGPNLDSKNPDNHDELPWQGEVQQVYETRVDDGTVVVSYTVAPISPGGLPRNVLEKRLTLTR